MSDRERFEEWARTEGEEDEAFVMGADGRYLWVALEDNWRTWKAASADALAAIETARREEREKTKREIVEWLGLLRNSRLATTLGMIQDAILRGEYLPTTPTGDENE